VKDVAIVICRDESACRTRKTCCEGRIHHEKKKNILREGRCAVKTIFVAMVCVLEKRRGKFL